MLDFLGKQINLLMKSNSVDASKPEDIVAKPPSMLGVRLRHARLVAGLTMMQVAHKSQCSESLISKIEAGQASPSLAMLHRIAVTLDTNIATLTTEEAPRGGARPAQWRAPRNQGRRDFIGAHNATQAGRPSTGQYSHRSARRGERRPD